MTTTCNLQPFDIASPCDWDIYAEQLDFYCIANDILDENKRRAVLLSTIGTPTFRILKSLVFPETLNSKTFDELVNILRHHFTPQTSIVFKRHVFQRRIQLQDEPIVSYVTELKSLSRECNFENNLYERLRDQFVSGLANKDIQRQLLAESSITFEEAVKRALAGEAAMSQVQDLQKQSSTSTTHHVKIPSTPKTPEKVHQKGSCFSCGGNHRRDTCKFREAECHQCHKKGHIAKVCRGKLIKTKIREASSNQLNSFSVHKLRPPTQPKVNVKVMLNGKPCNMEVDTGSSYSVISYRTYTNLWKDSGPVIKKVTDLPLSDFQGKRIPLMGYCEVNATFKQYQANVQLLITKEHRASLLGYDWFPSLGFAISGIHHLQGPSVSQLLDEFGDVFSETLGTYTGPPISLPIDKKANPIRFKARNVPLAMRPRIEDEIQRLIKEDVLEPTNNPKWSTPVVPVLKPSGDIRLCGDYKVTLNTVLPEYPYPIPSVQHLLSTLVGGEFFAKLDMAQAYLQLPVTQESAEAQTIITHRGAYKVKRLQFGVSVAPGIFQQVMEDLLGNIEGVTPYFDDILIYASSLPALYKKVRNVLQLFRKVGLRAKRDKCLIGVRSIDFLGYRVDASGLHPSKEKLKAIQNAKVPENKSELQAFLGLLNFYNSFLKGKAAVAEPLHRLLDKGSTWYWTKTHDKCFQEVKNLLTSESVLHPFDTKLPTTLTCDASPFGVGAVLSQTSKDGRELTIAFASRTLTTTERNYAQIDKEALALISGVKKFHHFLYGKKFKLVTDHKPLLGLFMPNKPTPDIISPRMLRWSVILNAYDFSLEHKPGKMIQNADALSRLSCTPSKGPEPDIPGIFFLEDLPSPPLVAAEIAQFTRRDPELSRVFTWVERGWPKTPEPGFQAYSMKQHEFSIHKQCLLWGNRVVIPKQGRKRVMDELHIAHPGIVRMKALARSYVWWPNIDKDIESFVSTCSTCQKYQHSPPQAPTHPWEIPRQPWSRIHIDFAGPFQGQNFLIVVDAYSKWIEASLMRNTSASSTIAVLRALFATHGIPDSIVSDNGPQFSSSEFQEFCKRNLIQSILVSPYHASSNGQAERTVQTTKNSLRKIIHGDWHHKLASFLLTSHITPSTATGVSPAELLMGRRLQNCLNRLHPDYCKEKQLQQDKEVAETDTANLRSFQPKDPVYIRSYGPASEWIPAVIQESTGPVSYKAKTPDGKEVKRHVDLIKKRAIPPPEMSQDIPTEITDSGQETTSVAEPESQRPRRTVIPPAYLKDYEY